MTASLGRAPRFVNSLLWLLTRWFTNLLFRKPINAHRARLQLPAITDVTRHILCPNPILAMEPELAPIPPEWPDADVIGYLDPGDGDPLSPRDRSVPRARTRCTSASVACRIAIPRRRRNCSSKRRDAPECEP